jgi:DNA replicative helicase MCM subunit Mcm2 (Cdc46/Mcm family)
MFQYDEFEQYWKDNHRTPLSARNRILASICPQLYGLYVVKLAIAVILSGGVTVRRRRIWLCEKKRI